MAPSPNPYNPEITDNVAEFLDRHRLGYVATTSPDGSPNISPKGTITRLDGHTLIFADIRSPDTIRNIKTNPSVEINVIDPILRKGYLFKGTARVINDNTTHRQALEIYRENGVKSAIKKIVAVNITSMSTVTSPLYDLGISEGEMRDIWKKRFKE